MYVSDLFSVAACAASLGIIWYVMLTGVPRGQSCGQEPKLNVQRGKGSSSVVCVFAGA